jgi:hypothetical protein
MCNISEKIKRYFNKCHFYKYYVFKTDQITQTFLSSFLTYIHTYHSRFIPEGVAEVSQIFLRGTHVLPKLVSYEEHCRRDKW